MTALSDVAFRFARECMGWEDAAGTHDINTIYEHLRDEPSAAFPFTDLNAVMKAVSRWHRKHKLFLSLYCYPEIEGCSATVFNAIFTVDCEHKDPCHALMQACLSANAKLKAFP